MSLEWSSGNGKDKHSGKQITLDISERLHNKAERKAGAYNYSKKQVLRIAIDEGLDQVI